MVVLVASLLEPAPPSGVDFLMASPFFVQPSAALYMLLSPLFFPTQRPIHFALLILLLTPFDLSGISSLFYSSFFS